MHQKRRPPIHIRLQQPHAFVRRVPALHHDIIQLVAQKLIDHALVCAIHFQKIRQRSHRRQPAPLRMSPEDSFRTVSVE